MSADELVREAEDCGVEFQVSEGVVDVVMPDGAPEDELTHLKRKLLQHRKELKEFLLEERGASSEALLALWREDPQLRLEFPGGVGDLEEHAINSVELALALLEREVCDR